MDWFSKNKIWLIGLSLSIFSAILRFLAVDQTEHPTGWDGYYYVMQVHSWITYGHLQSPDFSLIYPYFAVIALIVGNFILSFKIGVALLSGVLIGSVYFHLNGRSVPLAWICIACSYLLFSPIVTYFLLQFPKNALGLIFLIFFIHFMNNKWIAVLFLLATAITHRMTAGLAVLATGLNFFGSISWKWIVSAIILIVAIGFLPGVIHISDLQRFNGQFAFMPQWAPLSYRQIFPSSLSILFLTDLVMISLVIPVALYLLIKKRRYLHRDTLKWIPVALISIFPFFAFSGGDVGQRFFLVAPVAFIMIMQFGNPPRLAWSAVPVMLVLAAFACTSYKPRYFDPPNQLYSTTVGRLNDEYDPHNFPLVIAHQSLAEMIIFTTDFDALNWLPPEDMQPQHVLRLIKGVQDPYFRKYLYDADYRQVRSISHGYLACPEDVWQRFVQNASKQKDRKLMRRIYSYFNPMNKRPYFIQKGKGY